MMITINGLPMTTRYRDLKELIKQHCNISNFVFDNWVEEPYGTKKVKICLVDDIEGNYIIKYLDGYCMSGNILSIVQVEKSSDVDIEYSSQKNGYDDEQEPPPFQTPEYYSRRSSERRMTPFMRNMGHASPPGRHASPHTPLWRHETQRGRHSASPDSSPRPHYIRRPSPPCQYDLHSGRHLAPLMKNDPRSSRHREPGRHMSPPRQHDSQIGRHTRPPGEHRRRSDRRKSPPGGHGQRCRYQSPPVSPYLPTSSRHWPQSAQLPERDMFSPGPHSPRLPSEEEYLRDRIASLSPHTQCILDERSVLLSPEPHVRRMHGYTRHSSPQTIEQAPYQYEVRDFGFVDDRNVHEPQTFATSEINKLSRSQRRKRRRQQQTDDDYDSAGYVKRSEEDDEELATIKFNTAMDPQPFLHKTAVKMAIVSMDHPKTALCQEDIAPIQAKLFALLEDTPDPAPVLHICGLTAGALYVACADAATATWLRGLTGTFVRGRTVEVLRANRLQSPVKMVWKTKNVGCTNTYRVLEMLQRLNPALKTSEWKVINTVIEKKTVRRFVYMDRASADAIRDAGYSLYGGIDKSYFKVLGYGERDDPVPAATEVEPTDVKAIKIFKKW